MAYLWELRPYFRQVAGEADRWARLKKGIAAFLDACGEASYRRLVIHEAPAALGMTRFREVDEIGRATCRERGWIRV